MTETALTGSNEQRNDLAQQLKDSWDNATEAQLAMLRPSGNQYVTDTVLPPIYDKDFRRIHSALRLAGFDDTDQFTLSHQSESAAAIAPGGGPSNSRRRRTRTPRTTEL